MKSKRFFFKAEQILPFNTPFYANYFIIIIIVFICRFENIFALRVSKTKQKHIFDTTKYEKQNFKIKIKSSSNRNEGKKKRFFTTFLSKYNYFYSKLFYCQLYIENTFEKKLEKIAKQTTKWNWFWVFLIVFPCLLFLFVCFCQCAIL